MQTPFPTSFPMYTGGDMLADMLNDMSAGRIVATNNPSGAIVDGLKEMRAVVEKVLDASMTASHYHTSEVGLVGDLFNLYPAGPNPMEFAVWVYEGGGAALWQEMYDVKNLPIHPTMAMCTSAELFGWFAEPVTSMDTFKGMKFRTAGIWGDMLTAAGAAVVTMPGGEIYEAMQRGVIDAFEFSSAGVDYAAGFHELGANMHGPGIHAPMSAFEFLVHKDTWNKLPADLQAIVTHACEANFIRTLAYVDYGDTLGVQKLQDYGTTFVSLPEDVQIGIVKIANEKYDEIAAEDAFFAKVLQSQREFLTAYRAMKAFAQPDPALMEMYK